MMRLYISGNSPYARKTRIVARETGLISQIEEITVTSLEDLQEAGPGEKIPVLICEDGARLCESMIINGYLNELAHGQLLPKNPSQLRNCLEIESVGSMLMDSIFARSLENNQRKEHERSETILKREQHRTQRCLDRLDQLSIDFEESVTLASVAVVSALGYANWRAPEDNWADGREDLENYFNHFMRRPAFAETAPVIKSTT